MDTYFFIFSVNREEKEKFIYYFDRFLELMFKLYIFFNEIVDIELSSYYFARYNSCYNIQGYKIENYQCFHIRIR